MGNIWTYIIPLVVVIVVGFLAGKRQQFSAFCKELGEALLETSTYINIDKPTEEDTERFRKEWADVFAAGGSLLQKILNQARRLKQ
jgi:hypothetical protein